MEISKKPKFKDVIKNILKSSGCFVFERYNGKLSPVALDFSASAMTIDNSHVQMGGNGMPKVKHSYTNISKLVTGIILKYKPILYKDGLWGGEKYCKRSNFVLATGETLHNLTTVSASPISQNLESAYYITGEERPLTIEVPHIRDDATAEYLIQLISKLRTKPLGILNIDATFELLPLELGDICSVSISAIPTALNSKKYMVTGTRIIPQINSEPAVKIELTEVDVLTTPTPLSWQNTYSTGSQLQNQPNSA